MQVFIKGRIITSILLVLYLVSGPMMIAVREELINQPDSIINKPYFQILAPSSIFIFITTLYVFYSVRFVEMLIGIFRTLLLIFGSLSFDCGIRFIFLLKLNITIRSTGPFALTTALLCAYCILFPTYKSPILNISDKLEILLIILIPGLLDDIFAIIPILCGFLSFIILSPLIIT